MGEKAARFLVALDDRDTVIGYAILIVEGLKGHLVSLAVHPQFRRRGAGQCLIEAVNEMLTKEELIGSYLEVRRRNQGAYRLYLKNGWILGRKRPNYYENGDCAQVMVWRNLQLSSRSLASAKSAYRTFKASQRKNMGNKLRRKKNDSISQRVLDFPPFQRSKCVLFYSSLPEEASTDEVLASFLAQGKSVCLPAIDKDQGVLLPCQVSDPSELARGSWGLLEPDLAKHPVVPSAELDLIVVPGLAFDYAGGRVGFGGGYYDRFLSKCSQVARVALAYEVQMEDLVPMGPRDVAVFPILTDKALHTVQSLPAS